MKNWPSMLLILVFSFNAFANLCFFNFKGNFNKQYTNDLKHLKKINRYEEAISVIKRLKRLPGYVEPIDIVNTHKKWFKTFKSIEGHLFRGSSVNAIDKLRTVFRKVESSVKYIKEYDSILDVLEMNAHLSKDDLVIAIQKSDLTKDNKEYIASLLNRYRHKSIAKKMRKRLRYHYRKLGNNFDRYEFYRNKLNLLEGSFECKSECKKRLDSLYDELNSRYSLKTVKSIFKAHPQSVAIARKKEFINESFGFFRNIFDRIDFTRSIFEGLSKKGIFEKTKAIRFFKARYDKKAIQLHRNIIDKVSHAKLTTKQRYDLAKKEYLDLADEDFFVDFARADDYIASKSWKEILEYSKNHKDKDFHRLLTDMDRIGKRLGPYGRYNYAKALRNIFFGALAGGSVLYLMSDGLGSSSYEPLTPIEVPAHLPADGPIEVPPSTEDDISTTTIRIKYNSKIDEDLVNYLVDSLEVIDKQLQK
ncbi:MAG: hypothetical protein N4A33_03210 [Bacteriovoracaceae bacterium]|jgi:hypothetical protein|nr:hypothetical protein [Bacteriovoracaceae bacterium]